MRCLEPPCITRLRKVLDRQQLQQGWWWAVYFPCRMVSGILQGPRRDLPSLLAFSSAYLASSAEMQLLQPSKLSGLLCMVPVVALDPGFVSALSLWTGFQGQGKNDGITVAHKHSPSTSCKWQRQQYSKQVCASMPGSLSKDLASLLECIVCF